MTSAATLPHILCHFMLPLMSFWSRTIVWFNAMLSLQVDIPINGHEFSQLQMQRGESSAAQPVSTGLTLSRSHNICNSQLHALHQVGFSARGKLVPRSGATMTAVGDMLYIFGGQVISAAAAHVPPLGIFGSGFGGLITQHSPLIPGMSCRTQ